MSAQLSASATAARAHQEMFAYWASLRRGAGLPGRVDLHPSSMKRLLPTVSLIDVAREPREYRLRLAAEAGKLASARLEQGYAYRQSPADHMALRRAYGRVRTAGLIGADEPLNACHRLRRSVRAALEGGGLNYQHMANEAADVTQIAREALSGQPRLAG